MRIVSIAGARPQFIKLAVLSPFLRKEHREIIVHTGQHYDFELSQIFFDQLEIPKPEFFLRAAAPTNGQQVAKMVGALDELLPRLKPDLVLVFGDTNSTLAGAIASAYNKIPFAHVEAGPRSYQIAMPEEVSRVTADHLADFLFCPTPEKVRILKSEKVRGKTIHTGDLMLDAVKKYLPKAREIGLDKKWGLQPWGYVYVTLHRGENVDDGARLAKALKMLELFSETVVFPIHPRTEKRLEQFGLLSRARQMKNLLLIEPVGYLQSLTLLDGAKLCLTDSGGLQREAFFLGKPCLILRSATEWTELLKGGFSQLVDMDPAKVKGALSRVLPKRGIPLSAFGSGRSAEKITRFISRL